MIPAIILARGGSKRLLRKNILNFCGHPLVSWSIIQAKYCKYIDEVWLSTDDDEIAEIGQQYGARIIRRPDWPDADLVSAATPIKHAIEEIRKCYDYDLHMIVLPTSPCVHPEDTDRAFEKYYEIEKKDPLMKEMVWLCQQRETVVYKTLKDELAVPWIGSKTFDYLIQGPSRTIQKADKWLRENEYNLKNKIGTKHDIKEGFETYRAYSQGVNYYFICNWYQQYDISRNI